MFHYYLRLGLRSLRRNPMLTALMILTIGVGVAATVSTAGVLLVLSGNPIPHKSDRLVVPLLDNRPADVPGDVDFPDQLSYLDASRLLEDARAERQTAIFGVTAIIESGRDDLPPSFADGLAVTSDFFPMFDIPFRFGGPWDTSAERRRAQVVVLSAELSQELFGDEDPTGKTLRLNNLDFAIAGVLDEWLPVMRYYRLIGGNQTFRATEGVFLPFETAIGLEYRNQGSTSCNGRVDPGYEGLLRSECIWIQYWALLGSPADQEVFGDYLSAYLATQKELGRFPREPEYRLYPLMAWLDERGVVGRDSRLQAWLAFGFLLVCLVNTVGLLLAKFTARAGEVGVRRAVGATRTELFQQLLVEAGVIGFAGGLAGLVLSFGGLWLIGRQSQSMANIATMNMEMLAGALALALVASLLAGLLPTWRAVQVRPALQLKSQ